MKTGGTVNLKAGLFVPTMKVQPPAALQLAPHLATEVEALSPTGPLEAGVVEGSDCLVPGGCSSTFWQVWEAKNAHPRVVTIFKGGYCLNFKLKPPLTKVPVIKSRYLNRKKQRVFDKGSLSNDRQKSDNSSLKGHFPGILQSVVSCPQTRKEMATSNRSECGKQIFACSYLQDGNCRKYSRFASTGRVGNLTRPHMHIFTIIPIHPRYQKYLRFNVGDRSYQFTALPFRIATALLEFTMVAKEVKLMALAEGIRIHQYIDDWQMRAKTKQQCQANTHRLIHLAWVGS